MYKWDDVLIIGDSFCYNRRPMSWPFIVSNRLTGSKAKPRGKGFPGAAWWSVRKQLLTDLQVSIPKILIICHTEPYRLPSEYDYKLNFRSVEIKDLPSNLELAAKYYYENLMCIDFHEWSCLRWFEELDEIIEKNKIEKVIHFFCFNGTYNQYRFKKGVTIKTPLTNIRDERKTVFLNFKSIIINHLTPTKNKQLADNIVNIISNYPGDGVIKDD